MNRSIALPEVGPSRAMYLTHNIKRLLVKSGHIKKTDPSGHASLSTPTDKSHSSRHRPGYLLLILYSYSSFRPLLASGRSLTETSRTFSLSVAQRSFQRLTASSHFPACGRTPKFPLQRTPQRLRRLPRPVYRGWDGSWDY